MKLQFMFPSPGFLRSLGELRVTASSTQSGESVAHGVALNWSTPSIYVSASWSLSTEPLSGVMRASSSRNLWLKSSTFARLSAIIQHWRTGRSGLRTREPGSSRRDRRKSGSTSTSPSRRFDTAILQTNGTTNSAVVLVDAAGSAARCRLFHSTGTCGCNRIGDCQIAAMSNGRPILPVQKG